MNNLALRMRPDLVVESANLSQRSILFDPTVNRYFELSEPEYAVLSMLDGRLTKSEVCTRFERMFPPQTLSMEELDQFLFRLHQMGLVVSDARGQGRVLAARAEESRRRTLTEALTNPLAIRLPAIPVAITLTELIRNLTWIASRKLQALYATLMLVATIQVFSHFQELAADIPRTDDLLSTPRGFFWWLAACAFVKTIHEFAHAVVLVRFGGRVHSIGAMLFAMAPAFYCDVSDAWRLPFLWQRACVSMAGVGAELLLASVAVLVWRFSNPGLAHALAIKIIVVCSVGTIFFNANPLVRSDAYHLLADLIQIPNLGSRSRTALLNAAKRLILGNCDIEQDVHDSPSSRLFLTTYGALSLAYVCVAYVAALAWINRQLFPLGFGKISFLLAFLLFARVALPAGRRGIRRLLRPTSIASRRGGRFRNSFVVIASIMAGMAFLTPPHRVTAPAWIEPAEQESLYVTVPGRIVDSLPLGADVKAGDVIARLENDELRDQFRDLCNEIKLQELRIRHLRLRQSEDPRTGHMVSIASQDLVGLVKRREQLADELSRLTVTSQSAGTLFGNASWTDGQLSAFVSSNAAGADAPHDDATNDSLLGWSGSPLLPENRGSYLGTGTLLGRLKSSDRIECRALVSSLDLPELRIGQSVRVQLDSAPKDDIRGTLVDISQRDVRHIPPSLAKRLQLPAFVSTYGRASASSTTSTSGRNLEVAPDDVYYEVRIALPEQKLTFALPGAFGHAHIDADAPPLWRRVWRWLSRTFKG